MSMVVEMNRMKGISVQVGVPVHMIWSIMGQTSSGIVSDCANKGDNIFRIIGLVLGAGRKIVMVNIVSVVT